MVVVWLSSGACMDRRSKALFACLEAELRKWLKQGKHSKCSVKCLNKICFETNS